MSRESVARARRRPGGPGMVITLRLRPLDVGPFTTLQAQTDRATQCAMDFLKRYAEGRRKGKRHGVIYASVGHEDVILPCLVYLTHTGNVVAEIQP